MGEEKYRIFDVIQTNESDRKKKTGEKEYQIL